MARTAAKPSITGMFTSIRMTSKAWPAHCSTAACPFSAPAQRGVLGDEDVQRALGLGVLACAALAFGRIRGDGDLAGQGEDRAAPRRRDAFEGDAQELGQPPRDGQAKARAAVAPGGGGVELGERLEQARL